MLGTIGFISLVVFIVYWFKQRSIAKNLGDACVEDAEFLKVRKIKKYAGYIFFGALALTMVTQGSQLIDNVKNLFQFVFVVSFIMFLYYWRKQSTAKKEAGENYPSDDMYLHFKNMKKIVGCVCVIGFVIGTIIPNSQEEQQKQAAISAKYAAERAKEEAEKQAKEEEMKKEAEKEARKHIENLQWVGKALKGTDSSYEIESVDVNGNLYTVNFKLWTSVAGTSKDNIKLKWKNNKWELVK